jgi:hypothetical protein
LFKPEITELREIVADEIAIVSLLPENSAQPELKTGTHKPLLPLSYFVHPKK